MVDKQKRDEIPPGTLYMLILKVLARSDPKHGYEIANAIQQVSSEVLHVEEGSLYPALHRLEHSGLVSSRWSEVNGRRRRVYQVTAKGQRQLAKHQNEWREFSRAIFAVVKAPA